MHMPTSIRANENFHIVLWLLKDLCWVMDLKVAGLVMIVPTIAMAVYIAWRLRHEAGEFVHSLAVVCWIVANSIWMIGEFFYDDGTRPLTTVFFAAGLLLVLCYYAVIRPRELRAGDGVARQE
jgi:hypothetical protein